jgi:tetratricopeptide (TPR) repeat protein
MDIKEKIDQYILGQLSLEDEKAFEQEIAKNDSLKEEVEMTRLIANSFQRNGEEGVFNEMRQIGTEEEFRKILSASGKKKRNTKSMVVAISGVAAAILIFIYMGFQPKFSNEALFSEYYVTQSYDVTPTRGGTNLSEQQEANLSEAIKCYDSNDFGKALEYFNKITVQIPLYELQDEIIFYTAICQLETGEVSVSIGNLTYLSEKDDSEYQDNSEWLLALSYLKMGDRNKSVHLLEKIKGKNNDYSVQAGNLINKMRENRFF